MSNRYHINPQTGEAKPCSAQIQCRFGGDTPHFDTKEEAQAAAEKVMSEKYGSTQALKKEQREEADEYDKEFKNEARMALMMNVLGGSNSKIPSRESFGYLKRSQARMNSDVIQNTVQAFEKNEETGEYSITMNNGEVWKGKDGGTKYAGLEGIDPQSIVGQSVYMVVNRNNKLVYGMEAPGSSSLGRNSYNMIVNSEPIDVFAPEGEVKSIVHIQPEEALSYEELKDIEEGYATSSPEVRARMAAIVEKRERARKALEEEPQRFQMDQSEQWLEEARESREALQQSVMKDVIEKNMDLVSAYRAEMKKPDKHSFKKPLRELAKIATAEYNKREEGKISYQDVLLYIASKNL